MTDPCAQIPQTEYCRLKGEACSHRFNDLRELFLATSEDQDSALSLAKLEVDRRLMEMNKFRDQLHDAEKVFLRSSYYEIQHKNISDKLEDLTRKIETIFNAEAEHRGKSATNNLLSILALFLSFVVAVLHFFPGMR